LCLTKYNILVKGKVVPMLNYIQYPEDILRLEVLEVLVHAILVLDGDDPQTFYP